MRYFYSNPSRLLKNQDLLRVDYAVNARMNTYFRWVNDYQREQNQNGVWAGQPFPVQPQQRPKPGSSWSWTLINIISPTISSETTLSYNHQSQSLSIVEPNPHRSRHAGRELDTALSEDESDQLDCECERVAC